MGLIIPLSYETYFTPRRARGIGFRGGHYPPYHTLPRDAMACKSQKTSWAAGDSTGRSCGRGALSMSGATLPCAVALSPLSTQISARGVVTASTGSRCASLHLPRDLPTEGPPTPERTELVKRRAAGRKKYLPRCFSSLSCERHC